MNHQRLSIFSRRVLAAQKLTRNHTLKSLSLSQFVRDGFRQDVDGESNPPRQHRRQHTQGYQSMGSFHSDDLGMLMSLSDDVYQAPDLPFDAAANTIPKSSGNSSSHDFMLDRTNWTFLNHGAFGAALTVGYDRAEQWRWYLEQQPLRYFDRSLLPHLAYATRRLASFCTTSTTNKKSGKSTTSASSTEEVRKGITLIQNVTAGLNSVVRGYAREYGSDAHIVLWDTSYGSLKKLAKYVLGPERITEISLQRNHLSRFLTLQDHPHQVFLEAVDDALRKATTKERSSVLLLLDHTTSNTAINMPIDVIADHVKQIYGDDRVHILVDGAHGLLAQEVDLGSYCSSEERSSSIDFYVANGHKWLSCPRGVGMLFCPHAELRDTILAEPAVISHGVDEADLLSRFVWDGCRDYAAALAIPVVLDHWETYGPDKARTTMRDTLMQGIQILANRWHEDCPQEEWLERGVTLVPTSLMSPMALVRLPRHLCGSPSDLKTSEDAKIMQDFLFDNFIEVPIKCINGELFVRLSCHVYNDAEEFDRLGAVLSSSPLRL